MAISTNRKTGMLFSMRYYALIALCFFISFWVFSLTEVSIYLDFAILSIFSFFVLVDLHRINHFHPVGIFIAFSMLVFAVSIYWLLFGDSKQVFFFRFPLWTTDELSRLYMRETAMLVAFSYSGSLILEGLGSSSLFRNNHCKPDTQLFQKYWYVPFLIGFAALAIWVGRTGGIANTLASLHEKSARWAGNGVYIALHYFLFIGALLWFKENLGHPLLYRYTGLIILMSPALITGSRTNILVTLIAALYLEEERGRKIKLGYLLVLGVVVILISVIYQEYRAQTQDAVFIESLTKDLSMGIGFLAALGEGVIGGEIHLKTLLLSLGPYSPAFLTEWGGISPNTVFTDQLFPQARATFSMGVMGESWFIYSSNFRCFGYFLIGLLLGALENSRFAKSALISAFSAGVAIRYAKGGVTQGTANLLYFIIPLVTLSLAGKFVREGIVRNNDIKQSKDC